MSFNFRRGSGGGDDDDDDTDRSGLGGSIPGAPSGNDDDDDSGGSSGGGSGGSSGRTTSGGGSGGGMDDDPLFGGGIDDSGGSSASDPDPADEFGQELGGDPTGSSDRRDDVPDVEFSDRQTGAADQFDGQFSNVDVEPEDVVIGDETARLTRSAAESVRASQRGAAGGLVGDPVEAESAAERRGSGFPGRLADPAEPSGAEQQQREDFRNRAADEFDVDPDDVEITEDDGTLTAEADLTSDQAFFDELAGGRLSPVVEAGQNAREAAAEPLRSGAETVAPIYALPTVAGGGAARRGLDEIGVEAPAVDDVVADGLEAAGNARQSARDTILDVGPTAVEAVAEGAPSTPVLGPNGAQNVNNEPGDAETAAETLGSGVEAVEDAFEYGSQFVPDVTPREGARRAQDAPGVFVDAVQQGAPSQPMLGPDGARNVDPEPVEAEGFEAGDDSDGSGFGAEEALALGAAGVVVPEPTTSIGGAALAGGAILAGGAVALNERNEIDTPEDRDPITTELDVGTGEVEAAELGVPDDTGQNFNELDVGTGDVEAVEIDTPSDTGGTSEVDVPTVEAAGVAEQIGEEEDDELGIVDDTDFIIDEGVIEDTGPTVEIPEEEQMVQIREELERRQEFVRDDLDDVVQVDREPVRFPGEQLAEPSVEADTVEAVEPGFETGTGTGSVTDPVVGVGPNTDTGVDATTDLDVGAGFDVTPDVESDLDIGFEAPTVQATDTAAEPFVDTTVEAIGFEAPTMSTSTTPQNGPIDPTSNDRRRRRPRFGFDSDEFDDVGAGAFDVEADTFEYDLDGPDFLDGGGNDLDVGPGEFDV